MREDGDGVPRRAERWRRWPETGGAISVGSAMATLVVALAAVAALRGAGERGIVGPQETRGSGTAATPAATPASTAVPADLRGEPSLGQVRRRLREMESRLRTAIEGAAMRGGEGIRASIPPPRLTDEDIRKTWLLHHSRERAGRELRREPFTDGYSPWVVGSDLHMQAVYVSDRSAEEAYRRYLAAYGPGGVKFAHGCSPQAALDPEGALSCGLTLRPDGRHGGLGFVIRPEWITAEGRPTTAYGSGEGGPRDKLVTVVRISGFAPMRGRLPSPSPRTVYR